MPPEYHYTWEVDLQATPEALWPFVADTNRFNHDSGVPGIKVIHDTPPSRPDAYRLTLTIFGQKLIWDEVPFSWVYPRYFEVIRYYVRGPLAQMRVHCALHPRPEGGTRLVYQVWGKPKNIIGQLGFIVQVGILSRYQFIQTFKEYDKIAALGGTPYEIRGRARFASGGHERLQSARATLARNETETTLFENLCRLLENSDDMALQRLRPFELADQWGLPRRANLEFFIRASRAGLLDLRWELLCPMCRGAQASHASLNQVHNQTHCDFCEIDFTVNFDRQVEIVFRPSPAVRLLPEPERYCLTGPQSEPHVPLNETLGTGETRQTHVILDSSRYTLTIYPSTSKLPVRVAPDGNAFYTLDVSAPPPAGQEITLSASPTLTLKNPSTQEAASVMLERVSWRADAATAADVSALQAFRDLFPREALRAGQEINVGSVTLMFTDLRDSTRLYRQIGDGPAFGRVRQHFDILEQAIAAEGGAIVKTIGDAVMAVFREPLAALRAAQIAQGQIRQMESDPVLYIKMGIHSGPCIIVTLNERLDYFGTTVNTAARLPGLSKGGEIIYSEAIAQDPEIAAWLQTNSLQPEHFESDLKGFDEPMSLWRVKL